MRRSSLLFAAVAVALIAIPATATVIHVPADYATIQAGIDASSNGDTVLVAPGTYNENITFSGKAILLRGAVTEATIIQPSNNSEPIVEFINDEGEQSILDGFTIRGASSTPAVVINSATPTISHNNFTANNSVADGGAIKAIYPGPDPYLQIFDNLFENNHTSASGAGIHCYGLNVRISGNSFYHNWAEGHGGAIFLRASDASVVNNNLFVGNRCASIGGALILSEDDGISVFNNTLDSNSTSQPYGAGISIWYSDYCHIYNNIVVNSNGAGIYCNIPNQSTATYNDVWNNTIDYGIITAGDGSISVDPLFEGGSPYSYHLTANSLCIDTGEPSSPLDPDSTRADMGAYYFPLGDDYGYLAGTVTDTLTNPIAETIVMTVNGVYQDTTDAAGYFFLSHMNVDHTYNLHFYHPGYSEATIAGITINPNDTTVLDTVRLIYIPSGYIVGIAVDSSLSPLEDVNVVALNTSYQNTTDADGRFILGMLPGGQSYNIELSRQGYVDTTVTDVFVSENDTTFLDMIVMRTDYSDLYILGDVNGDGDATPLADIAFMADYFLGGPPPPYYNSCPGDVNGNCNFNGIDIVYGTNYWMGGPPPVYCTTCPPPEDDPVLSPSGSDPGMQDSVIVGNLDLTPIIAQRGDTVTIPIWAKTDEQVPAINIPLAIDATCGNRWIGGTLYDPISGWTIKDILAPENDQPSLGYSTQTLMAWKTHSYESPCLNTQGTYQQIASFRAIMTSDPDSSCDVVEIIAGNRSRAGGLAFCDSMGFTEWVPAFTGGLITFAPPEPDIAILPTSFYHTVFVGQTASWPLLISDEGLANLVYGLQYDPALLELSADTGSVAPFQTDTILVTFSAVSLPEGTYSTEISVNSNDPDEGVLTIPVTIVVREQGACSYAVGDANGSGTFNGLDVTYSVAYFKGGPPPPYECECTPGNTWYVAGDVNQSCNFNGLDVTYMVAYFKGGPQPHPCADCQPPELLAPPAPGVGPIPAVQPILIPNQKVKPKAGSVE